MFGSSTVTKVKPNPVHGPLVAGCRIGHKPRLLHVRGWDFVMKFHQWSSVRMLGVYPLSKCINMNIFYYTINQFSCLWCFLKALFRFDCFSYSLSILSLLLPDTFCTGSNAGALKQQSHMSYRPSCKMYLL